MNVLKMSVLAGAACIALAGCGATQPELPPRPPSRTSTTITSAFAQAFTVAYPALADGRSAKGLTNDAVNTCSDLAVGEAEAIVMKRVQLRFERPGVMPTAKQTVAILALIRSTTCPSVGK